MTSSINTSKNLFALFAGFFMLATGLAFFTEQYLLLAVPFAALFFYAAWQNLNAVFFLLLFTLPLSFEYKFSAELGTDIPDEFLMILVAGLFFAYCCYSPEALSQRMLRHPLMVLLFICLGWTIITVLFSTTPIISLKFLLAKSWYAGAFILAPLIIFKQKKSMVVAAITFAAAMVLVAVISLIRHRPSGFSFATINDAVFPFFRNHVNYSAMLVCTIPLLAAFLNLSKTKNQRFLIGGVIILMLAALFFSYARGAWLALIAGILAYWLIKKRLLFHSYIGAIIITAGFLFLEKNNDHYLQYANDYKTTIFHKNFSEHLVATYRLKDVSTAERFYRWIAGVRMIKDNWLTGYGPNTFNEHYKEYAVPAFKTWVSDNKDHSTVHNYFLLITIEQGIPGLFLFLILSGAMLYYGQYLYHRVKDVFYKTVAITTGVVLTMVLIVNFLSDLIETDKIGSLFFLCLSTLIMTDMNSRKAAKL